MPSDANHNVAMEFHQQETGAIDPQPLPQLKSSHSLKRKPVPAAKQQDRWVGLPPGLATEQLADHLPQKAGVEDDVAIIADQGVQALSLDEVEHYDALTPLETDPLPHTGTSLTGSTLVGSVDGDATSPSSRAQTGPSKLSRAWEETKYFAGGLIHHPAETTKHFSVLRHSSGIVYYQASATAIAISIFSDSPLPPDRKLWLQQKGWTGNTGMAAKQLFKANGGWLDVTPAIEATAEQLPSSCERAWQRDCRKFYQKEGMKRKHQLRETCVVRIPAEAEDGYFRIVMCGGGKPKNKLCPSPVFRIASTNASPSSMKGASLSTLPLEAGIKILSMVANNAAMNAVSPVANIVSNTVGQYMPGFWEREAASAAYGATGIQSKIDNANETYQSVRDTSYQHVGGIDEQVYEALDQAPVMGDRSGPQKPYPFRLSSNIVKGAGRSSRQHGIPTSNLAYVREEVTMPMHGIYFGWARIKPSKQVAASVDPEFHGFYPTWHPAIISVSIDHDAPVNVTYGAKKRVAVHLVHYFNGIDMTDSVIEVIVMGFLREQVVPSKVMDEHEAELQTEQDSNDVIADIAITQASLARPAWAVEHAYRMQGWKIERSEIDEDTGKIKKLTKSMTDRYVDARQAAQRQVDRVPLGRIGVRRNVDNLKSQAIGTGGIFVRR